MRNHSKNAHHSDIYRLHYWKNQELLHVRSMGQQTARTGYAWNCANRGDDFWIFQYTLTGNGFFKHGENHQNLPPHTAFLAKVPSSSEYFLPATSNEWEFVYLEIKNIPSSLANSLLAKSPFFDLREHYQRLLPQLEQLFQQLKTGHFSAYENSAKTYQFLLSLLESRDTPNEGEQITATKEAALLSEIMRYLEKNFQKDLALEDLADEFGKSKYQLIRLFKKEQNQTPMETLQKMRLIKAQELLVNHRKLSIKEIAQRCGYQSPNYFSKVFKKKMHKTPQEYRENFAHFKNQKNYFY